MSSGGARPAKIRFSNESLRGMFAEALLRRLPRPKLAAAAKPAESYTAAWMNLDPSKHVVDEMAACLADMRPDEVEALVATVPGSAAEGRALSAIMPFANPCLARGAVLKTNSLGMRVAMAEALYHRSFDASQAVSALAAKAAH